MGYHWRMIILLAVCALPLIILIAWGSQRLTIKYFGTRPQYYFGAGLITGIAPAILLLFALVLSTVNSYNGKCYGFTDAAAACSFVEYLTDQMFWAMFLVVPLLAISVPTSLVIFGLGWKRT